ncbi:MAG: hypothetical protein E6Z20_10460, partial [Finegoldia magna]|nr:hypothetical protein [Finegoldia magna]
NYIISNRWNHYFGRSLYNKQEEKINIFFKNTLKKKLFILLNSFFAVLKTDIILKIKRETNIGN